MKAVTVRTLGEMKRGNERFCCVTAYDASFARVAEAAGIETILVGDSLGMVLQGHASTLPVTVADMAYHTRAVSRAVSRPMVIADMPFGSYHESAEQAIRNASRLMKETGCAAVKLEGGRHFAPTVNALVQSGIPVIGHVGLMPQHFH